MSNYCQNCYELTEEISKLKAENIHLCEYKDELQEKLEKIKEFVKCSKEPMNCGNCPMCEECEELCVNDENLQDIILQIIEGAEDAGN